MLLALKNGVNVVDLAPNYMDGDAMVCVKNVMKKVNRDEIFVVSKVGNIIGTVLRYLKESGTDFDGLIKIREDVWHSVAPKWIETEISRVYIDF